LKQNTLYANGKVSISQNDTIEVFADTLIYKGDENLAYLIGGVILINGDDTLYTQELEYNTELKTARYTLRAYMKAGKTILKSQIGSYDTKIKEAWFYDKVSIESDSTYITTDSLKYITNTEESFWKSPGIVKSGSAQLYSDQGLFNGKTKTGIFNGNAQYKEDSVIATADTIILDKENVLLETQFIILKQILQLQILSILIKSQIAFRCKALHFI
jgi:lipopolysaccharide export system protein LptA